MSTLQASDLDSDSRSDLIARAQGLGIEKADVLTRAELIDEIVKRSIADPLERRRARGLLGVARDLVARVVERGLHLPDAAALIRGLQQATLTPLTPPIATVTLAEIYAGQGHRARALTVLDEVLAKEPEHAAAREMRDKIAALPEDIAPSVPSSEPPPEAPIAAVDTAPASDVEGDRDTASDTLRPAPLEGAPTLVPTDLPTWHAGPPEVNADETARSPAEAAELEPEFAAHADQLAVVPADATSALARWELGGTTFEEARARAEGGELILRIVAVTPSWDGPKIEIRDIEVALPVGDWWVCDLPPGAVLRAAIGWRSERGFDPLAVALDVAPPDASEPLASDRSSLSPLDGAAARRAGIEQRARRRAEQGIPPEGRALSSWRTLALAPWEAPHEEFRPASIDTH